MIYEKSTMLNNNDTLIRLPSGPCYLAILRQ